MTTSRVAFVLAVRLMRAIAAAWPGVALAQQQSGVVSKIVVKGTERMEQDTPLWYCRSRWATRSTRPSSTWR